MRARLAVYASLVLAGLGGPAGFALAQVSAPEAAVHLSAGVSPAGALWHVPAQPFPIGYGPAAFDTFELARRLEPTLTAWAGVTRYVRPWLGFGIEAVWVAARTTSECRMQGQVYPDPLNLNLQTCQSIDGTRNRTTALGIHGTATLRAFPNRHASPFVRLVGGFALLTKGFVQTVALVSTDRCPSCIRTVLEAPHKVATWSAAAAAGVTLGTGPGARFRIEARDMVLGLPVVTGPANPILEHPVPDMRIRAVHRPTLAFGVDAVLGGPRRRRY